jgi:hypothetical protein
MNYDELTELLPRLTSPEQTAAELPMPIPVHAMKNMLQMIQFVARFQ